MGKRSSIKFKKFLETFVFTSMLNGGLNQVIFLFRLLFFSLLTRADFITLSEWNGWSNPLLLRALLYVGLACLNISSFFELKFRR